MVSNVGQDRRTIKNNFQLLAPLDNESSQRDLAAISNLLNNLRQNIQDDINKRFNSLTG